MSTPGNDLAAFITEDSESATALIGGGASTSTSSVGTTAASAATGTTTSAAPSGVDHPSRPSRPRTPGLAEWLESPNAMAYQGRWVLLSDEFVPLAAADGPSPLLEAHEGSGSPLIIFVSPPEL